MRSILQAFDRHLDDVERSVDLVGDLKMLGAATAPPSSLRSPLCRAATTVRSSILAQRTWETIALDGSLLYIAAQFEEAVRGLVEKLIQLKCQRVAKYDDLPEELRDHNTRLIGELLRRRENPRDPTVDHIQVVEDFLQCQRTGVPVRLYVQGFSQHDRNLTPDQLKGLMKRAGVAELWPSIGRDPDLQDHLNCVGDENAAITQARNRLSSFISDRNMISHRGPAYQTIGPTVMRDYVAFFRAFFQALVGALESHIAAT